MQDIMGFTCYCSSTVTVTQSRVTARSQDVQTTVALFSAAGSPAGAGLIYDPYVSQGPARAHFKPIYGSGPA